MTGQLPPTTREPSSEEDIRKYTVGELKPHASTIQLVDYDPAWPGLFDRERSCRASKIEVAAHAWTECG